MSFEQDAHKVMSNLNPVDFGESLFDAAVQKPYQAIDQLTGNHLPDLHIVSDDDSTLASKAGNLAGFVVDFAGLSKLTGSALDGALPKLGMTSDSLIAATKLGTTGAIYGGIFTPSEPGSSLLASRLKSAAINASAFAVMGGIGEKLGQTSLLASDSVKGKVIGNAIAGGAGGVASAALGDALNGQPLSLGSIARQGGKFATLGGALGGLGAAVDKLQSSSNSSSGSDSSLLATAKNRAYSSKSDTTDEDDFATPTKYREVGYVHGRSEDDLPYSIYRQSDGREFYQLDDGTIGYHELPLDTITHPSTDAERDDLMQRVVPSFWAPYGSDGQTAYLRPNANGTAFEFLSNDEAQGLLLDSDGNVVNHSISNDAPTLKEPGARQEFEQSYPLDNLVIFPKPLETDAEAAQRLVPMPDGKLYSKTTTSGFIDPKSSRDAELSRKSRVYYVLPKSLVPELDQLKTESTSMAKSEFADQLKDLRDQATRVIVPEQYAADLDNIRALRATATKDPLEEDESLEEEILAARREIFVSGYRNRFLPEHAGQLLDATPNRSLITRVLLDDNQGKNDHSVGTAMSDGTVAYHKESYGATSDARRTMLHEWSHQVENTLDDHVDAYEFAQKLENFRGSDYAEKEPDESWAVHMGEMMLDPNPELLYTLGNRSPISTVVLADALQKALDLSAESPEDAAALQARINYVRDVVAPEAGAKLTNMLTSGRTGEALDASEMLTRLSKVLGDDFESHNLDFDQLKQSVRAGLNKLKVSESGESKVNKPLDPEPAIQTLVQLETLHVSRPADALSSDALYDGLASKLQKQIDASLQSGNDEDIERTLGLLRSLNNTSGEYSMTQLFNSDVMLNLAENNIDNHLGLQAFALYVDSLPTAERSGFLKESKAADSPFRFMVNRYFQYVGSGQ